MTRIDNSEQAHIIKNILEEDITMSKKLLGKIPMKTVKKVAFAVGVSIAGIYIISKLPKIEADTIISKLPKIEDDTIIITDIVDGSFKVMEKRGERNE